MVNADHDDIWFHLKISNAFTAVLASNLLSMTACHVLFILDVEAMTGLGNLQMY